MNMIMLESDMVRTAESLHFSEEQGRPIAWKFVEQAQISRDLQGNCIVLITDGGE
jgi:hypothetical protein